MGGTTEDKMNTGSLINNIMSNTRNHEPTVGMGATELCWTDRHAYTVTQVSSPKRIEVQQDTATRTDSDGMTDAQSYSYAPNPEGRKRVLTLRKNGSWHEVGTTMSDTPFSVGTRREYHDYSF